jgi:hypothetical protein
VYDSAYNIWDELMLSFNDQAHGEEEWLDAGKAVNPDLNFYSWSSDHRPLTRDFRPFEDGKRIQLGLTTNYRQRYIIRANELNIPAGHTLYLHDLYLNQYVLLTQGAEYNFSVTKDEATQGDHRFELGMLEDVVKAGVTSDQDVMALFPNPVHNAIRMVYSFRSLPLEYRVYSLEGVVLQTGSLGQSKEGNADIDLSSFPAGLYIIQVVTQDKNITQRIIKE